MLSMYCTVQQYCTTGVVAVVAVVTQFYAVTNSAFPVETPKVSSCIQGHHPAPRKATQHHLHAGTPAQLLPQANLGKAKHERKKVNI